MDASKNQNNVFAVFYGMLNEIKESGRSKEVVRDGEDIEHLLSQVEAKIAQSVTFSGEEGFGKYLDLHLLYNKYKNSKFGHQLDYIQYLGKFPGIDDEKIIPSRFKTTAQYRVYIEDVLNYLISFMDRARPLMFLDRVFKDLEENQERGKKRPRPEPEALMVHANTVEELMELGLEKLKEGLDTLGVKSGGTARQRAERLLLAKNNKLDRRHLKKERHGKEMETALLEAKVKKLCEILNHTLEQTRQHVQNKQAMTPGERDLDAEDEDYVESDSDKDGDDDKEIYNPLKLPMGWDGRPIPYWLYKLHGLRQDFKCEICGNQTYFGRRAFETHFKGARHQHGMRCLGIPNTKSFHEITTIQEARNLWQLIKERQGLLKWRPEVDEEFEDADGNVYDTKTFKDLSRQGLI